ncbi:MAG: sulfotransferase family protein [Leptolyngbyaceae cyanobacterium]
MQSKYFTFSDSGAKAPLYLSKKLAKKANISAASKELSRSLVAVIEKSFLHSKPGRLEIDWPEKEYIDDEKHHFIYCPIPKVACSSFKRLVVQISSISYKEEILELPPHLFHSYVNHSLTFFAKYRSTQEKTQEILQSNSYFKFAIVRNPWDRLVSAYLNKFVSPVNLETSTSPGKSVVRNFYAEQQLEANFNRALTFREFIKYLSMRQDKALDGHWQPQIIFLNNHKFDYIGRFEKMDEAFDTIQENLNIKNKLPWANKSNRSKDFKSGNINSDTCYSTLDRTELRRLKSFPNYRCFYTPDLVDLVGNRYQDDIKRFTYDF